MARRHDTVPLRDIPAAEWRPLVGAGAPTLLSALQALVSWATSRTFREQVMADCGFPLPGDLPAFLTVNQLVYRGVATPTDLADAIDTSRSNLSKITTRLQAAGLVFRAADPRDDRGVVIGLTRRGRELGNRIVQVVMRDESNLPGWSTEELKTLEHLVIKFATTIDALPGHPLTTTAGVPFTEAAATSAGSRA